MGAVQVLERSRIGSQPIQFKVGIPKSVTITVRGPDGSPMKGVEISLLSRGRVGGGSGKRKTDDSGLARLDDLWRGGFYAPWVSVPDLVAPVSYVEAGGDGWTGQVEVNLEQPARTQKVKVIDAAGKPVARASVWAEVTGLSSKTTRSGTTGDDGCCTLSGLPQAPTEFRAWYWASGHWQADGKAVAGKDTPEIVITVVE